MLKNSFPKAILIILAISAVFCPRMVSSQPEDSDAYVGRDPFVPLVGVDRVSARAGIDSIFTPMDVKFEGIVSGTEGRKALILNGELIEEEETIGLVTVKSVGSNEAIITIDGKDHTIMLYR